jgi:L-alanine-DL-glutamate epimerase-like enolase superfamily enzyme
MLTIRFHAGELRFTEVFSVASNTRSSTEVIDVEIGFGAYTGYGQASFPPYMKEKRETNMEFLERLDFSRFDSPFCLETIYRYMDTIAPEQRPAKAAVEMALYDLMGKLSGKQVAQLLGLESNAHPDTSMTIGIGPDDYILRQLHKARDFRLLKLKLGSDIAYNHHVVTFVKAQSGQDIGVDFNQGLTDREIAIDMVEWLHDEGVKYVEQPLPVHQEEDAAWLKLRSPLDIFGDESIQVAKDIWRYKEVFHGVNIKLMKCGGIGKAYDMARTAKVLGLKTMLGCMVESACALTAAAHLAPLFDRLDLDGHLNLSNDPYKGLDIIEGRIVLPEGTGLGVVKTDPLF